MAGLRHSTKAFARVVFVVAAIAFTSGAGLAADAGEFLVTFGQRAVEELNDENLSQADREDRFRTLFNEAVDVPAIGKFILGRHWRTATVEERADFLIAFEDFALQRFLPIFTRQSEEYAGESFDVIEVRPAQTGKGQFLVRTEVVRYEGTPARINWRIREKDDRFKILDVTAEGVSMALTLRQEYNSVISRTGGVTGLVDLMREKLDSGAFAPKN